jgi:hypothetical protein
MMGPSGIHCEDDLPHSNLPARQGTDGTWIFWPEGNYTPEQITEVWDRLSPADKRSDQWDHVHQFSDGRPWVCHTAVERPSKVEKLCAFD